MLYDKKWDQQLTPPAVDAIGKVLFAAADYIEQHGWARKVLRTADDRVCALGSIFAVQSIDFTTSAIRRLYYHLKSIGVGVSDKSWMHESVEIWNDITPGLTKEEVIATLRAAAVHKRSKLFQFFHGEC